MRACEARVHARVGPSKSRARVILQVTNEKEWALAKWRLLVPGLRGLSGILCFGLLRFPVVLITDMYCRVILCVFAFLAALREPKLSVLACTDDRECRERQNSTATSICCLGSCGEWWNCKGGCISDDTCEGGKICFSYRCEDPDINFPAYCDIDLDCEEQEQCESGQCKPAPRPVSPENTDDVQVSFDFDPGILIIVGSTVGALIFLIVVGYISYRCFKRHRRRRLSRGAYTAPSRLSHGVNSSSPSRNQVEIYALYRQQGSTFSDSRPPPEYDSLTLDSNLEVESSSPPPYDNDGRTISRTCDEAQV